MIELSLHPDEIPLGKAVEVALRLTNGGIGDCTNLHLTLQTSLDVLLIQGRTLHLPCLKKGQRYDHALQVQARASGSFRLVSSNFSYRDHLGQGRRVPDVALTFRSVATTERLRLPALELALDALGIPANAWSPLRGRLWNDGEGAATEISVSAAGPSLEARRERLGDLAAGAALTFTLPIRAGQAGTHVPITLEVRFRDGIGQERRRAWPLHLAVEAAQSAQPPVRIDNLHVGEISQGKTETHIGDVGRMEGVSLGAGGGETETHIEDVGLMKDVRFGGGGGLETGRAPGPRFCSDCGEPLGGVAARFCPNCGRALR